MSNSFLPYARQDIDDDDIAAVVSVLRGETLTTGPAVAELEKEFTRHTGARFAVASSSGTAALHLATLAVGLEPGDVAIVPSTTFLATANAVRYVGGEVVFADVDPETGLMGKEHLIEALGRAGSRARAVYPVHLAGQCVDMAALQPVAKRHGLFVIEDACHALGTRVAGIEVGKCQSSDIAVFSLHPAKIVAMGEGGVTTTNDRRLAARMERLRSHGMTRRPEEFANADLAFDIRGEPNPWYYEMPEIGFNYRAPDILCALGASQMRKLPRFAERRRALARQYDAALAALAPLVRPIARVPDCEPAWHLYVVLVDFAGLGIDRRALMNRLRERGVGTQVHYIPVHRQPYYRDRYGDTPLPGADAYYARCLALPLYARMDDDDVDRVVEALSDEVRQATAGRAARPIKV